MLSASLVRASAGPETGNDSQGEDGSDGEEDDLDDELDEGALPL